MIQFEDKLHASAQRLAEQENKSLHVPQNPMQQKRTYWGWVATPAAAVVGLIFGMSLPLFMRSETTSQLAQSIDTIRIIQPVRDTIYLTQVVEKEKVVYKPLPTRQTAETAPRDSDYQPGQCTSIQCDGINYSILATN
ncbi:MAG: hypothetical protein IKO73_03420 [Bacteroidaceae bacterium]|nr:hypothetical protein [Bacteroidaceae bacterium]